MSDLEVGDYVSLSIKVPDFPPGTQENDLGFCTPNTLQTRVRSICNAGGIINAYFEIDGVCLYAESEYYVCTSQTWYDPDSQELTGHFILETAETTKSISTSFPVVSVELLKRVL